VGGETFNSPEERDGVVGVGGARSESGAIAYALLLGVEHSEQGLMRAM
jgi:hypothetical protein